MSKMTPNEMAHRIGDGLLSFPVTPFRADHSFDEAQYRANMDWLCSHEVAGLFAAGGTGEFFSLTPAEVARVVTVAVDETRGRVPVLAGAGYGTAIATEMAAAAERAGADGILLLPPYLTHAEQDGLAAHIAAVCAATKLGVIVYNRDNAIVNEHTLAQLCERCPNLVGYKDGIGDIELMTRVQIKLGDRLTYIGGLPTAETFALPYLDMGVTTYSSAVFNFVPGFATRFYAAVRRNDRATIQAGLRDFILPLVAIRNRKKGYAVSIIKAGMRVIGRNSGPVRPPLTDLDASEMAELTALVERLPS
ncbi:5-dehydro-4-deoxyglucarate dehydratase [Bradyrhizobium sp. U87765 SZCCT0131]|uniref:5-dehydro-4-deoxyglucarate dehydratase n=1 Tax=unclassified Bradyrhizobium TaxID=2631580 RepID=UPI001BAD6F61|nr:MULTISPECIES: 5-dehydro-4-deoxyglucarate dehydratase [unclassified Bradyrhizobium]MBR1218280.1 5-dehydro-4-deoxyglucarate dehydratase [Bradyrhizobium sp. U87765 SZCCT0131]MBR1260774.1 5-dehydro-4-deoxyglucarate dehydratase [Bradyrhizobium sp. U87765 SZCCT0134]MBR1303778.1 5-dehydro-4-deoxyglucarate dehydratase [Bradyrhizobium sp. U87765 SZCCT0110]MBR1319384.1 5-dehydro-4-deoxyglucarate dehydratase [Bradyrhizobium sp. U87765 SZCCT0109]MBR1347709.1 5-dehydro-4-deoxyglucarate dehydratase [Brad